MPLWLKLCQRYKALIICVLQRIAHLGGLPVKCANTRGCVLLCTFSDGDIFKKFLLVRQIQKDIQGNPLYIFLYIIENQYFVKNVAVRKPG